MRVRGRPVEHDTVHSSMEALWQKRDTGRSALHQRSASVTSSVSQRVAVVVVVVTVVVAIVVVVVVSVVVVIILDGRQEE